MVKQINCKTHPTFDAYEFKTDGKYRLRGKCHWMNGTVSTAGYMMCTVRSQETDKQTSLLLHRAMWETFNGPIPEKMEIDHIDNNKINNKLENLKCVTLKENRAKRNHDFLAGVRAARLAPRKKIKSINLITDEILVFENKSRAGKYFGCSPALIYYVCEKLNLCRTHGGYVTFEYTDDDVTKDVPRKIHDRPKGGYKYKTDEERKEARKEYCKRYREKQIAFKNKDVIIR